MLVARGHTQVGKGQIGGGDLRWVLGFGPALWCIAVQREGLVLDTRFVPRGVDGSRPTICVYFLVRGSFEVHGGERFDAPATFLISGEQLDGPHPDRPFTFMSGGEPFAAIELHFATDAFTTPPSALPMRIALDPRVMGTATEAASLPPEDETWRRHVTALLSHVADAGLITKAALAGVKRPPAKTFVLLWGALRPMIERFYLTPTMQEVGEASGISVRQVDRYVQDFVSSFALVGKGWRSTTRRLRLKVAVILLSAAGATVAEVASAVGYGSADAMARAFRDEGLIAPTALREELASKLPRRA